MIKVSVMYPYSVGSRFDHAYYQDRHMPMLKEKMGESCLRYSIDRGVAGATPGSDPVFVAMCHIYCASVEAFNKGFGPHVKAIMADVPNYTDIRPQMQISEVVAD